MPASDEPISLIRGGEELLDRVEPLWKQLREHHANVAPIWRGHLLPPDFRPRREYLLSHCAGGLLVLLASSNLQDVGYCVCSISADRDGEIDSLFVAPQYRRRGIATRLMTEGMRWLREQQVQAIFLDVMHGNEDPLKLYERFGFRTRTVRMRYLGDQPG
jgi:ribosomal protein S18 acetylase RimI-like enzyme